MEKIALHGELHGLQRSLLAAWLLNDEITARGLSELPTIEEHALKLCPPNRETVFQEMEF